MFKTFKWIYRLGVLHERRRIKLLIAENRMRKPEKPSIKNDWEIDEYARHLDVWLQTSAELDKLTNPYHQEMPQMGPIVASIDQD